MNPVVIAESPPRNARATVGPFWKTLMLVCVTNAEVQGLLHESRERVRLGLGHPRLVLFSDPDEFRRVVTPLRLTLLSRLASGPEPESLHELARELKRDYHSLLKDIQFLADIGAFETKAAGPKGGNVPDVAWRDVQIRVSQAAMVSQLNGNKLPEDWPIGSKLDWAEWTDACSHIEDSEAVARLGLKAYRTFMGANFDDEKDGANDYLPSLARLLDSSFRKVDDARLEEIRGNLEGRGKFTEPALWESPNYNAKAHMLLEKELVAGNDVTLAQLLQISHDLEHEVRPNALRLLWAVRQAAGDDVEYSASQIRPDGTVGSLGYATTNIADWVKARGVEVVGPKDAECLIALVMSMTGDEDGVALADVRNWIDHRDFFLLADKVMFGFHPAPGRRLVVKSSDVTHWRRATLGLMALLYGFKVMFLAHVVARSGGFSPKNVTLAS